MISAVSGRVNPIDHDDWEWRTSRTAVEGDPLKPLVPAEEGETGELFDEEGIAKTGDNLINPIQHQQKRR